ncbi:MAG: ATP-binding protein [Clostridia bacterium]|nr:ATP-binding protein [Clostridia bacterium]
MSNNNQVQFDNDFIKKTYRTITSSPDLALTESVANAWDAGAHHVWIQIPEEKEGIISIEDDGTGMSNNEFRKRWMTLTYDRLTHQGNNVIFADNSPEKRIAYGRNGVGRHGMICFSDTYEVETWQNGKSNHYVISLDKGSRPFFIKSHKSFYKDGHGTKVSVQVKRNLPSIDDISSILSGRFLYDPNFVLCINGKTIDLSNHKDIYLHTTIQTNNKIPLDVTVIDSTKTALKSQQHGIAFWVAGRLVGQPSWSFNNIQFLDGRSKVAKRFTIIIKSNDLLEYVLPDWTGFIESSNMHYVFRTVGDFVHEFIKNVMSEKREEIQKDIISDSFDALDKLPVYAQREVSEFIERVTEDNPLVSSDFMKLAVNALTSIQESTKGKYLLNQLSSLSPNEIDKLSFILDNWDVDDIMTVMNEIDKRILVIEAIERTYENKGTDELHTLHPLVLSSRWLFGPQYDSPMFTSNKSLSTVISKLFKDDEYDISQVENPNNRPDIVCLKRYSFKAVCTERYDQGIMKPDQILIIELKRGGFKIEDEEVSQASSYVRQIKKSGILHKSAEINAYVVGAEIGDVNEVSKTENGTTYVVTYGQLVQTAKSRLFNLKDKLQKHYDEIGEKSIVEKALAESRQLSLDINE